MSEHEQQEVTESVVEFVLNHERNILDGVGDFGLLLGYLELIKASFED